MSRTLRVQFPGAYYHVFNRGVNKGSIFFDDQDKRAFLRILGATVSQFQLRIFAYCLMDNHFHLFLQTRLANLDKSMQRIQSRYAQYVNLRHERVGYLFQGRYQSRLVDVDAYSLTLVRYIHQNPIRSHLTKSLEEYFWSSYPHYVGKIQAPDWLDTTWVLGQFDKESQKALLFFEEFHTVVPEGSDPSDPYGT